MEGYLKKQASAQAGKVWQRRYFILQPEKSRVMYYKKQGHMAAGKPPHGKISLRKLAGCTLEEENPGRFTLHTVKLIHFEAASPQEALSWMRALAPLCTPASLTPSSSSLTHSLSFTPSLPQNLTGYPQLKTALVARKRIPLILNILTALDKESRSNAAVVCKLFQVVAETIDQVASSDSDSDVEEGSSDEQTAAKIVATASPDGVAPAAQNGKLETERLSALEVTAPDPQETLLLSPRNPAETWKEKPTKTRNRKQTLTTQQEDQAIQVAVERSQQAGKLGRAAADSDTDEDSAPSDVDYSTRRLSQTRHKQKGKGKLAPTTLYSATQQTSGEEDKRKDQNEKGKEQEEKGNEELKKADSSVENTENVQPNTAAKTGVGAKRMSTSLSLLLKSHTTGNKATDKTTSNNNKNNSVHSKNELTLMQALNLGHEVKEGEKEKTEIPPKTADHVKAARESVEEVVDSYPITSLETEPKEFGLYMRKRSNANRHFWQTRYFMYKPAGSQKGDRPYLCWYLTEKQVGRTGPAGLPKGVLYFDQISSVCRPRRGKGSEHGCRLDLSLLSKQMHLICLLPQDAVKMASTVKFFCQKAEAGPADKRAPHKQVGGGKEQEEEEQQQHKTQEQTVDGSPDGSSGGKRVDKTGLMQGMLYVRKKGEKTGKREAAVTWPRLLVAMETPASSRVPVLRYYKNEKYKNLKGVWVGELALEYLSGVRVKMEEQEADTGITPFELRFTFGSSQPVKKVQYKADDEATARKWIQALVDLGAPEEDEQEQAAAEQERRETYTYTYSGGLP
eukprot:gb/GEZN01002516.1/.p1 GENE.gb/GEZN01002516.1/~~gb/GEZN01002516.1/.p1  ORF type:complete len:792 (-),score=151.71 gb/GEZN01002516.1/:59-2434(-)